MEPVQGRKAVGVQATYLCRAAHRGYGVTQSCKGRTPTSPLMFTKKRTFAQERPDILSRYLPVRSLAVMELSRLSCWSVVASSLPPPPAPEHTEEEVSTASPSASSTSLSIKSLKKEKSWTLVSTGTQSRPKRLFYHLRDTGIAAVLFLPKTVLLYKVIKALRLFPHVVKRHTFCYGSCCNLEEKVSEH